MQVKNHIHCETFPCADVRHECYLVPEIDIKLEAISIIMISEAAPGNSTDYYYAAGNPLFQQTTVQAFNDAGVKVSSMRDFLDLGIYFTTAVKCAKTGYGIKTNTVEECSRLMENEIALFPNVKAYMLMGDVAIKTLNHIARRLGEKRVIPAGSTYKIRNQEYYFQNRRAFPSYLQAGPSFFIEKSKRRMIAADISAAMKLVQE